MTRTSRERGVALLLALFAIVILTGAALTFARFAANDAMDRRLDVDERRATDLLLALDAPLKAWLEAIAPTLVLPPDATTPATVAIEQSWTAGDVAVEVHVVAWDLRGLVSLRAAQRGLPLRRGLPDDVAAWVDALPEERREPSGLDLFESTAEGRRVFPVGPNDTAALGAWIATPLEEGDRLHVHTAPLDRVDVVFRQSGRGGLEAIAAARAEGRRVSAVPPATDSSSEWALPTLVTQSDAWAFRVDLRVGSVRRSWWEVFRQDDEEGWRCVQRLSIPR